MAAAPEGPSLADLGEWQLIDRLAAFAPAGQFDDDAALLTCGGPLVVTSDVLVEGVHFSDATTAGFDVGWRAAAANLSDLAAMGCTGALGLTVGLVAPGATPWPWVEAVYIGLQACVERQGGMLLGGDCSGGAQRLLAITALGNLPRSTSGEPQAIRRRDGRPGDLLVCTGPHGLSRLGLALLQPADQLEQLHLPQALIERALERHQRPCPRFDAVRALRCQQPRGTSWRVAGTDSSDGLAAAAAAIARSSGCRALLDHRRLPLDPAMANLAQAEAWCLGGGEDFELVLALEPPWAEALVQHLPSSAVIGALVAATGDGQHLAWLGEQDRPLPGDGGGYEHFS